MFFIENFMTVAWTPNPRAVVTTYGFYTLRLFGIHTTVTRLIGLGIAILATIGLSLFLRRTLIGTAVRACSEDLRQAPSWVSAPTGSMGWPSPSA